MRRGVLGMLDVLSSAMAHGKKLFLIRAVLLCRLRNLLPEASGENSPWWGCEESVVMFMVLVRQRFS